MLPYDDVVTMTGINNPGLHNESSPPNSVQNNNGRLSGIYRKCWGILEHAY